MKKFLVGLFLLLGVTAFAKEVAPKPEIVKEQHYVVNVSAGVVPLADYSAKGSTVDGDGAGFDFDVTVTKEIKSNWYAGLGFGVHKLNEAETRLNGHTIGSFEEYDSYPVYLTTKYEFKTVGDGIKPFVKADLGYAFNGSVKYDILGEHSKTGVDNGLYAGVGFGIEQNNINAGLMFKTTQGEVKGHDYDNYRMVLSVGYDFDFNI